MNMKKVSTKLRSFQKSLDIKSKIHDLIPGGAHTYNKGDDQYPEFHAPYLVKGLGSRVWDADGNQYIEYGSGSRSIGLGHAFPSVVEAAYQQMKLGSNFVRPAVLEMQAAERFLEILPSADMVKFCKNGSDATTAALKIARAVTGRDKVAICGNHPFFSVDDWFIGTTAIDAGIPQTIKDLTVKFEFNNLNSVIQLFNTYPDEISCLMMEPEKYETVDIQFLKGVQQLCTERGVLFILDEMVTGFRWSSCGYQTDLGIVPDLTTFGKAMGNGFAVSALAGKREFMEIGGLYHNTERVFLLSTTHGAENHALSAFMAVTDVYEKNNVVDYLKYQGERLRKGMLDLIQSHQLEGYAGIIGHPACLVFTTKDQNQQPSQPFRTLFMQELIKRGVLAPNLVINFSHSDSDIDQTLEVINESLYVYKKALDEGVEKYLMGKSVAPVYRKRN